MAVSEVTNGLTTPGGTETTLWSTTSAGTYQLALDPGNLQGGATPDILEIHVYHKIRASSPSKTRLSPPFVLVGAQAVNFLSFPYAEPHYLEFAVRQTQGTNRQFAWSIRSIS